MPSFIPVIKRVSDIQIGKNPVLEAWVYHFLIENNLEHLLNPSMVSSPEQLRFMVALRGNQVYVPCSDEQFFDIFQGDAAKLKKEYLDGWHFIIKLVASYPLTQQERARITGFCRYRFKAALAGQIVLPSRLIKRLVGIVLTQCGVRDPYENKKQRANSHALQLLRLNFVQSFLKKMPILTADLDLPAALFELNLNEMARLMVMSSCKGLHNAETTQESLCNEGSCMASVITSLRTALMQDSSGRKIILFIPARSGGLVFDIMLIKSLLRQGHQVMLSLKDAFYFNTPSINDLETDETLRKLLKSAHVIESEQMPKNELLHKLREFRFLVIPDGTSEQMNLYRTSVTFARAWKESDLIIAKGQRNKNIFLETSHEFTRDILCYWRDDAGDFQMSLKPKANWVVRFAEKDLLHRANELIRQMEKARATGQTIMFYSAIIGSLPGETKTAILIVNTFVKKLREQMENTFIINPAEHFVEGMDGDDLMYMWEHVQRSGLLHVWRFQTSEDIEQSFLLLGRKLPATWLGKDATFSTGCTKEMRIALDMQKDQSELQIIGPQPERFFRRRDYGVGKYYDVSLQGSIA